MQKITPHLWFDTESKEAAEFYISLFPNSHVKNVTTIHNTPSGDCDVVSFALAGLDFMAISAGPLFTFNPSISFHVACATTEEVDHLWEQLIEGGEAMMPLGTYPFSERYGWLKDRYGLSWQLMYVGDEIMSQKITPVLMYVGEVCGKAEEAVNFYTSLLADSEVRHIQRYAGGAEPDAEGTVQYADFTLAGGKFGAMDSAHEHKFSFNEAIALMIKCDTQEEIDVLWEKLSAVPEAEQCGWLKDKYGVSWQIVPSMMEELMASDDQEKIDRMTQAFLKMKKFDIAKLKEAYDG